MDQVFIDALVNQALGAYKVGGDEGLKRWKESLPVPHLAEFEKHCGETLLKAIAGLDLSRGPELRPELIEGPAEELEAEPTKGPPATDPRKRHRRDRRRTKPL